MRYALIYIKQCRQPGCGTTPGEAVINCTPPRTPGKFSTLSLVLITTPRFSQAFPLVPRLAALSPLLLIGRK